jgi:hypothetical protein
MFHSLSFSDVFFNSQAETAPKPACADINNAALRLNSARRESFSLVVPLPWFKLNAHVPSLTESSASMN